MKIHPQEARENGLVGLVLSLHHLSDHRLNHRAFPVTKEIERTRLNLSMYMSLGGSPIVVGHVFPDT